MHSRDLETSDLFELISGVNRHLIAAIEAQLRPSGLSIEQFRVLEALSRKDGQPMGELALRIFVDSPTLTKIIDKMIAHALVFRGPDAGDRRRVLVFISDLGAERFMALRARMNDCYHDLIGHLETGETTQLRAILQSLLGPSDKGLSRDG